MNSVVVLYFLFLGCAFIVLSSQKRANSIKAQNKNDNSEKIHTNTLSADSAKNNLYTSQTECNAHEIAHNNELDVFEGGTNETTLQADVVCDGYTIKGKQKSRAKQILIVLFTIVLLAAIALFHVQSIAKTNARIASLESSLEASKDQLDKALESVAHYKDLYFKDHEKAVFLDNKIALIVNPYGEVYHRYDCHHFQNSNSYWAYNIEAAESRGYRPCAICH